MTDDPLNRYASLMNETKAPDHLPNQVLQRARVQKDAARAHAATPASPRPAAAATVTPAAAAAAPATASTPAFSVKRFRFRGLAVAACTALAVGAALLTAGPISGALGGGDDAPAIESANFFQMAAFADEGAQAANGVAALTAEMFAPVRTSAGPRYDRETDSYPGDIEASRSYNLNLDCTGSNVTSMTYQLQGEGVNFFNWELTYEGEAVAADGSNITGATGNNDNFFTVDYADQDINSAEAVNHEIFFNYTLDDELKAAWNEYQASTSHERVPGTMSEDERIASVEASNKFELALARHDTTIIANARLVLTATFSDGTTQTKTYRIAPVDDFDAAYQAYLDVRLTANDTTAPDYPALYTIEEVA